jgi:hypothetical protein
VKKAIERYMKERGFYDVLNEEEIVLTETGVKECQREIPGHDA